jgi:Helix-turn-helix domain/HNH endonuclease
MSRYTPEEIEKFWSQVQRLGPTECWPWLGYRDRKGYGQTRIRGERWKAHRLSYTLVKGPIPPGLLGCHECDRPWCCNPDHTFPGTAADNTADRVSKGRGTQPFKMTMDEMRELRQRFERGETMREIGRSIGRHHSVVARAIRKASH